MKESEIERELCRLAGQAGGKAYKFVSPGNTGVPDRLVVLPGGRIGFVELKRPGASPRRQQVARQAELEALGCYAAVVDSKEKAEEAINEIRKQALLVRGPDSLFHEMINRRPGGKGGIL